MLFNTALFVNTVDSALVSACCSEKWHVVSLTESLLDLGIEGTPVSQTMLKFITSSVSWNSLVQIHVNHYLSFFFLLPN